MKMPTGFDMMVQDDRNGQWPAKPEQQAAFSEYILYLFEDYRSDWERLCDDGTILGGEYRKGPLPEKFTTLLETYTFTIDTTSRNLPLHRYRYRMAKHITDKNGNVSLGKARAIYITPLFGGYVSNILKS